MTRKCGGMVKSCGTESRDHAASSRSVRSTNRPFTNFGPARTSATSSGALTLLHLPTAASMKLDAHREPRLPGSRALGHVSAGPHR